MRACDGAVCQIGLARVVAVAGSTPPPPPPRFLHAMTESATDSSSAAVAAAAAAAAAAAEPHYYALSRVELVAWVILYSSVAVLAVVGNALVVYVIARKRRMRTVTTYFMANLAVGDLLTGLLAVPFKFQAALLQVWAMPAVLCKLVPFIETVSLSVSVFTLTGSAVDRFRAVYYPFGKRLNMASVKLVIAAIWIVSVTISLPFGLFHQVRHFGNASDGSDYRQCLPLYSDELWWKSYNVYLTIIQYFVPCLIVDCTYTLIAFRIWSNTHEAVSTDDLKRAEFEKNKRKVIKTLIIVVVLFTFCWLPYETYLVLNELATGINSNYYIIVLFFCSHWLAMSNSCLNPIIYGFTNRSFCNEYVRVFKRILCGADKTERETHSGAENCNNTFETVEPAQLNNIRKMLTTKETRKRLKQNHLSQSILFEVV